MAKWTWVVDARCRDVSREVKDGFFSYEKHGGVPSPEVVECCRLCPVRETCLEHALGLSWPFRVEMYGYWAGTTMGDRRRMLAELGLAENLEFPM